MSEEAPAAVIVAVSSSPTHGPRKRNRDRIRLIAGVGVEGDAHAGEAVRHRSRARRDPTRPNLRQVHLIGAELHRELADQGLEVGPGAMGENVTTAGIDLLAQPRGTRLRLGDQAVIELTGLRNPCAQLDGVALGLMRATLDRGAGGELVRKAGVMAIVIAGGEVRVGDSVQAEPPTEPVVPLEPV